MHDILEVPTKLSMRISALRVYGGSLKNLYNVCRFDQPYERSRRGGHSTRKDFRINRKHYKPWQVIKHEYSL